MNKKLRILYGIFAVAVILLPDFASAQTSQSGSSGIQGTISSPPPTQAANITIPSNGQNFTQLPVRVAGSCPGSLLVKVFKNNVFAGAVQCKNNSFDLQTDLFTGQNELVARVYDELDQAGPDSNTVNVTFTDNTPGAGSRILLTSNYAKRGANPGETLTWPIILSGGIGPYALSVDWGDGQAPDLISQQFPGTVGLKHDYQNPGVYNIVVKGTDANGNVAFLQLVGVGNGALGQDAGSAGSQSGSSGSGGGTKETIILWQPAALLIPFILSTFWLGKRYELKMIRKRIEQGDRPF